MGGGPLGGFGPSPDLLGGAASATLPQQGANTDAMEVIRRLQQARLGGGGGVSMQPQMGTPKMPLPPIQIQQPGIPQGPFASKGAAQRADKQALYSSLGNIVKAAETRHYDMKVQKLQKDIETMTGAIQGYNQAQSIGDKAAMEHNANVINSIVTDPKKAKEIAKAFEVNINPMAEDKKKDKPDPAKDALKKVFSKDLQTFQQGGTPLTPQAQAIMRSMPMTAQMDPRAAATAELTKAKVLPSADEQLRFASDMEHYSTMARNNQVTNETRTNIAKQLVEQKDRGQFMTAMTKLMTNASNEERTKLLVDVAHFRAQKQFQASEDRTKAIESHYKQIEKSGVDKDALKVYKAHTDLLKEKMSALKVQEQNAKDRKDPKMMQDVHTKMAEVEKQMQMVEKNLADNYGGMTPEQEAGSETIEQKLDKSTLQELNDLFKDDTTSDDDGGSI
jgi:hypothetical protein